MKGEFNPVPKPSHKRRKKTRKQKGTFSPKVINEIWERDRSCVACGTSSNLEAIPHHIIFRSQGGEGTKRNGCILCVSCHRFLHDQKEGSRLRYWLETWKDVHLDQEGNLLDHPRPYFYR